MSRHFYLEKSSSGRERVVISKRPRSHACHCSNENGYFVISRNDWNLHLERERLLEEAKKDLISERDKLKASVLAAGAADQAKVENLELAKLQAQYKCLLMDNDMLRNGMEKAERKANLRLDEEERLKEDISCLEKKNKKLQVEKSDLRLRLERLSEQVDQSCNRRVAELRRDLEFWRDDCSSWKSKFEDAKVKLCSLDS